MLQESIVLKQFKQTTSYNWEGQGGESGKGIWGGYWRAGVCTGKHVEMKRNKKYQLIPSAALTSLFYHRDKIDAL
eukprot:scaffold270011_cov15-Tisochrysis_lutea.AAC.1